MKIYQILFLICIQVFASKLIFVYEMSRHGARAPLKLKDGVDVLGESWQKAGALTIYGMQEHYNLGRTIRERYIEKNGLLSDRFHENEIYTNSSSAKRCQLSAYSQLVGIYPKEIYEKKDFDNDSKLSHEEYSRIINGDLNTLQRVVDRAHKKKRLFPIHLMKDSFEGLGGSHCYGDQEMYNTESKIEFRKEMVKRIVRTHPNIVNEVDTDFKKYGDVYDFCDTFICDYRFKLNLSFIDPHPHNMYKACTKYLGDNIFYEEYGDPTQKAALVRVSPIMRFLVNYIDNIIENLNNPYHKLIIHLLHDDNVGALQIVLTYLLKLNLHEEFINFASHFFFEIHQNDNSGEFSIVIVYNGVTVYDELYSDFKKKFYPGLLTDEQINEFCSSNNFLR